MRLTGRVRRITVEPPSTTEGQATENVLAFVAGLLGLVFLASGAVKMRSPTPAALAMTRFGVVRRVRSRYGRAAGVAEAATGVFVLAFPASPLAFVAPAALSGLFVVLLARALRSGERFPCACFGRHGVVISRMTLLRAGALVAISLGGATAVLMAAEVPGLAARLDGVLVAALTLCALVLTAELVRARPFSTVLGDSPA